jgi:biopolymer transport protein ExbD
MAEVDSSGGGGKKKGPKKVSTKIDMTPMVDLAFLLITFFMLTTTFSKPKTMELNMPDKTKDNVKQEVEETRTTSIILGTTDRVYYYTGIKDPAVELTDYSANGIRKVLMQKIKERPKGKDPIFIIKSMDEARYKNIVDILDEMRITGAQVYAMVDITPGDIELVEKYKKENNITD